MNRSAAVYTFLTFLADDDDDDDDDDDAVFVVVFWYRPTKNCKNKNK